MDNFEPDHFPWIALRMWIGSDRFVIHLEHMMNSRTWVSSRILDFLLDMYQISGVIRMTKR